MDIEEIQKRLEECSVDVIRVDPDDIDVILQAWNDAFAYRVKRETGYWIHKRFRWHSFSFGFHQAIEGEAALRSYLGQWNAGFVVFDDTGTWCFSCAAEQYPDLSSMRHDLYVAHRNMKWTMAFTHEQPDIGPFFAESVSAK